MELDNKLWPKIDHYLALFSMMRVEQRILGAKKSCIYFTVRHEALHIKCNLSSQAISM